MRLSSESFASGGFIPPQYAAGRFKPGGGVEFSANLSPQLAWSDLPSGTRSLALTCIDIDVPSSGADVDQPGREVPASLPRVEFVHWVMVDLPPTLQGLSEGECSRGFTARGKSGPATLHGARHGLNDYTGWFAGHAKFDGQYFGYDGPFPPANDSIVHRYVFTLYALDCATCPVEGAFTAAQVRQAMQGHVLAQARIEGRYTLNPRLLAAQGS